ncbi:MAG TPA: GNAT family N-acetyltransferase [Blastocatellia bacterium]|nr:GNAT family N-acetyltransferase [Blastocatellia bacterium]
MSIDQCEQRKGTGVELRPACPEDEAFLYELYCSTRKEELAAFGLDDVQRKTFLELQFRGQRQHYRMQSLPVDHRIVMLGARPIGHLIVMRSNLEIRLGDISLLAEYRGGGIGTALIRELFAESARTGKPVSLHVERSSRAVHLYERLGFVTVADTGSHFRMERPSQPEL